MTRRTLIAALLMAFSLIVTAPAYAAEAPTIAIVDVEKILSESKAAQSLQKQITAKKEAFQKEFSAKEAELKKTETQLLGERETLSAEDFSKKRKAYEESILETRKLFQKRRNALDEGLTAAMSQLRKSVAEATTQVAEAKNYDIVLTRDSVLIAEKTLDITTDVLAALNAKVTDIPLKVE